jgi:uncharacterized protein (DUF362 family)
MSEMPLPARGPTAGKERPSGSWKERPAVYLEKLDGQYAQRVQEGLEYAGFFTDVAPGSRVFLKPNLTFPEFRPGVMTSRECLEAVTELLVSRGYRVIIGEADSGGYNRFSMDEVFQKMGVYELARRTGAEVVNLSFAEPEIVPVRAGWRPLEVPVPKLLLREVEAFISLPVPKIHMNTLVSLSIKNQWGCIQEPSERLKLHPYFGRVMFEICRRLPRPYAIVDGRFGLNRSGPMRGDVVDLNWLMVSNDLVAADRLCCRLMQVAEERVKYLKCFRSNGWWPGLETVQTSSPLEPFVRETFYLERQWTDWPGLFCFNSAALAWVGYRSPLAGFLHWLLYLFRQPFYDYEGEKKRIKGGRT